MSHAVQKILAIPNAADVSSWPTEQSNEERHFMDALREFIKPNVDMPLLERNSTRAEFSSKNLACLKSDDVLRLKRKPKCKTRNSCQNHDAQSGLKFCLSSYIGNADSQACNGEKSAMKILHNALATVALSTSLHSKKQHDFDNDETFQTNSLFHGLKTLLRVLCSLPYHSTDTRAELITKWSVSHSFAACDAVLLHKILSAECRHLSYSCYNALKQSLSIAQDTCRNAVPIFSFDEVQQSVSFLQKCYYEFKKNSACYSNLINIIIVLDYMSTCLGKISFSHARRKLEALCSHGAFRFMILDVASAVNFSGIQAEYGHHQNVVPVFNELVKLQQILQKLLTISLKHDLVHSSNIIRIASEYFQITGAHERNLLLNSVTSVRMRLHLCLLVLEKHCLVSLQKHPGSSASLCDILDCFTEDVIVSTVMLYVYEEQGIDGDSTTMPSAAKYCEELCVLLNTAVQCCLLVTREHAVCSLMDVRKDAMRKDTLPPSEVAALEQLPKYVDRLKQKLQKCVSPDIVTVAVQSLLDRLSCLCDLCEF